MSDRIPNFVIDSLSPEPGQTVVLTVPKTLGGDLLYAAGEQLKEAFPDNAVVVLQGDMTLSAQDDPIVATITREEAESILRPQEASLQPFCFAPHFDRSDLIDALREDAARLASVLEPEEQPDDQLEEGAS